MPGLTDRRDHRAEDRPEATRPAAVRPGRPPVEVVRRRGRTYLRPIGPIAAAPLGCEAARPGVGHLGAFAIGLALLAGTIVATLAFMAAFSATFHAATRALPEGSLSAPRAATTRALARERDRRRDALAGYDRHIAAAAGEPALQEAWRDLRRHDAEMVARLGRHLDSIRRRPPAPAGGSH